IEADGVEVDALAREVSQRPIDDCGDMWGRVGQCRTSEAVRRRLLRPRKIETGHARIVPRDGGEAERCFKYVVVSHQNSRCVLIMRYALREIPPPVSSSLRRRPELRRSTRTSPP